MVIPGYLRAVRRYWTEEDLRRYQFSTIAWGCMRSSVGNYRKKLNREKRQGTVISLDQKYAGTTAAERLVDPVDWIGRLERRMLLMDCAGKLTKEQREILSLKGKGYHLKEIAQMQKRTPSSIRKDVEQIRKVPQWLGKNWYVYTVPKQIRQTLSKDIGLMTAILKL